MSNPRAPIFAFLSPYLKAPGWGNRELLEGMDQHLDLLGVPKETPVAAEDAPTAPASPAPAPKTLRDPAAFFAVLRGSLGSLTQEQVDGFNRLLGAMGKAGWPIAWVAYGLATSWWETNKKMQPVEEGYYLGPERAKRHQRTLRYFPWYGRGDVQLTWEDNYRKADAYLASIGLIQAGELIANPDLALRPDISAAILVWGMGGGKYTGKGLGNYLPRTGPANHRQFVLSRYVVNIQDKASQIADVAMKMQAAVEAGGWS